MLKDWQAMATELTGDIRSLRAGAPDVMRGSQRWRRRR